MKANRIGPSLGLNTFSPRRVALFTIERDRNLMGCIRIGYFLERLLVNDSWIVIFREIYGGSCWRRVEL